jgi:putative ABC transport system permease protein
VLPGVALDELWQVVGVAERVLLAVSAMVVAVGLAGLVAVVLAGLNERRRELAILRSVGARPAEIFLLLMIEAVGMTVLGAVAGIVILGVAAAALAPVAAKYGLLIAPRFIAGSELVLLLAVVAVGMLASLLPGYRAYKLSLADGLTPRL